MDACKLFVKGLNMDLPNREVDIIVVGSGPGGATVAKELSNRNKKVLILEWGDYKP